MSRQPVGIHGPTHDPEIGSDPIPGFPRQVWGALLNDGSVLEGTGFTAQWSDASGWSSVTAYVPGDITNSGGSTYVCVLANTNQIPPNATYWTLVSGTTDNAFSIIFTVPFTNPPVVLPAPNNDSAPAADGRYTATLKIRTVGYIVVITENVDDPDSLGPQDGGFDFLCIEPGV